MKLLLISFLLFALISSVAARADSKSGSVEAKKTVTHFGEGDKKDVKFIHGQCSFFPTPKNPFDGPCVGVMLDLIEESTGKVYLSTRVNEAGEFGFGVESLEKFSVVSGSKFYELAGTAMGIRGGDNIAIKLRQK